MITHGPPAGILDQTSQGPKVGCEELLEALTRIRPKLHLFGHIHEDFGTVPGDPTLSVNACNCDLSYRPINPPVVIEWDEAGPRVIETP